MLVGTVPEPVDPSGLPTPEAVLREPSRPEVASSSIAVELPSSGVILPPACACCGAEAASSSREARADGMVLIVPYCGECLRHVSAEATRSLAVTLSSGLLSVTVAATLPLLWEAAPAFSYGAIVLGAALAPLLGGLLRPRRADPGHTAFGRAARWLTDGRLACTSAAWGAELAALSGGVARPWRRRERRLSFWSLLGPLIGLALVPLFYGLYHPAVRVLNLSDVKLHVTVDGRHLAVVEPTSTESPSAGVEVRVPAGRRLFEARDSQGRRVEARERVVESGKKHLYAPGSTGYCFWLESTGYGQHGGRRSEVEPLDGEAGFWALGGKIDTWFAPNPVPSGDARSTGGVLRALRQAPCRAAPEGVRRRAGSTELPGGAGVGATPAENWPAGP